MFLRTSSAASSSAAATIFRATALTGAAENADSFHAVILNLDFENRGKAPRLSPVGEGRMAQTPLNETWRFSRHAISFGQHSPMRSEAFKIIDLHERHATNWDKDRERCLFEKPWLDRFLSLIPRRGSILDIGCGSGEPIDRFFIEQSYEVVGADSSTPRERPCCFHQRADQFLNPRAYGTICPVFLGSGCDP
jgi:hypothetical protein